MKKSHLLSLTSFAAMMLSVMTAQNALSASRQHHGNGNHDPGNNQSSGAVDPGVRGGTPGAGGPITGLTAAQQAFFTAAQARFSTTETVSAGLGPGFNELSCAACHIQPAIGGSSPTTNPQVADANTDGATNVIPPFITANGPIREARFVLNPDGTPDGGVHDLFSIQGRADAPGCVFAQPDFAAQLANNNVIFRTPINTFGDGLIEGISDQAFQNSVAAQAQQNASLGISGQFNLSGNTGNITRFGWKAQNSSMLMFAGEAYNVEEGVTNQLFPDKRNFTPPATTTASPQCAPNPLPEDTVNTVDTINSASTVSDNNPDIINFALYMSLLAPPAPAVPLSTLTGATSSAATTSTTASSSTSTTSNTSTTSSTAGTVQMASVMTAAAASPTATSASTATSSAATPSTASLAAGLQAFLNVGCSGCHIMNQTTGNLALIDTTTNPNISNITINPFSDYAVHNMGTGLADGVTQGNANGSQFKTAALWGIGQRVFFLHDGRTSDLLNAIEQHASSGSEANQVITQFNMLSTTDQQNILNFLRDL
jgi:CxxC motif-containing protein (DUF1111 family)